MYLQALCMLYMSMYIVRKEGEEEVQVEGTAASQRGSCIRVFSTMSETRSPDLPGAPGPSQNLRRFQ